MALLEAGNSGFSDLFDKHIPDGLLVNVRENSSRSFSPYGGDVLVSPRTSPLDALIDSIGRRGFFKALMDLVGAFCSADHLAVYNLTENGVRSVGAISGDGSGLAQERVSTYADKGYWKYDPSIEHVRQSLVSRDYSVIKVDVQKLSSQFRRLLYSDVVDKVVLAGIRNDEGFCMTLVRTGNRGHFTDAELDYIFHLSGSIISAVAKHFELSKIKPNRALTDLPDIEETIFSEGILTKREAQVCARILYGMCVVGIALDLEIGEESIKTYRSRAYNRLGIGSQRELLMWYLSIWKTFDA